MNVVKADGHAFSFLSAGGRAAVGAPATAVGDPAEFLHVDVDQLSRAFALVAVRGGPGAADQLSGQRIAPREPGDVMAVQDPRDRPGGNSGRGRDAQGTCAHLGSGSQDGRFPVWGGARGQGPRAGRPVSHAGVALGTEPAHPAVHALAGDAAFFGDVGDRAAIPNHPLDEQKPAPNGQSGVNRGQESLLASG